MSVTEVASSIASRVNYIYCLDLIVFVCVLVIAGRPDGLAITFSALILGVATLVYRCTVSVKSRLAKPKAPQRGADRQFDQRAERPATPTVTVAPKPSSKSWLRDSE